MKHLKQYNIFENMDNNFIKNNLSYDCLIKLGFKNNSKLSYILNLQKYGIIDYLIIYKNNILFARFDDNSTVESMIKKSKLYIDKYLEYRDHEKNGYVILAEYNDTFILYNEYKKIMKELYKDRGNLDKYYEKTNGHEIVFYTSTFDKIVDLIKFLANDDHSCNKKLQSEKFNL